MNGSKAHDDVDVVIVGAGPSGYMLANWLSRLGVKTRILDKRSTKILHGHADGLAARSVEIFESFDMHQEILRKAEAAFEIREWKRDEDGRLTRSNAYNDFSGQGMSRFIQQLLGQAQIETALENSIQKTSTIKVERMTRPTSLSVDETLASDPDAYAVRLTTSRVDDEKSEKLFEETINAKYVVGCDGARSWVREQLGIPMEGVSTDAIWGVIDIKPITNFPDIRMVTTIAHETGAILLIPRENGLTRFYVELGETRTDVSKTDHTHVTADSIFKLVQRFLAPYNIEYEYCDWYSNYQVGQRVAQRYTDKYKRVFLAGDAVHTHSPKAGQGMNTSMQDSYNLGWKLGGVINHRLKPDVLDTYEPERRPVAQTLIELDHELFQAYSDPKASEKIAQFYMNNLDFMLGFGTKYPRSIIVATESDETDITNRLRASSKLASAIIPGMRIPDHQIAVHANFMPMHVHQLLLSNGLWRLIIFAGNVGQDTQMQRVNRLGEQMSKPGGMLWKHSKLIEVLTVHCAKRLAIEMDCFHRAFFPFDSKQGHDYSKIFIDQETPGRGGGKAYESYGIDPDVGCVVLVRPDQHVAYVGSLDNVEELETFLDGLSAN